MRTLIALAALIAADPAFAACHHYRFWAYRFPQPPCPAVVMRLTPPEKDTSWYVEITKMPDLSEDEARQMGADQLRKLMRK